jgi:hypothetical protein
MVMAPAVAALVPEVARFDAALAALVARGVDVSEIEHLDPGDVALPLEVLEQLVAALERSAP